MSVNLKHFNYSPAYLDLELFLNPQMDPEIKKLINFFTKQILFGGSVDKTRQWLISKTPFCFLINWQFLAKCFLIISPSHIMDMDVTSSLFLCPFNRVYLGFFLRNINRKKLKDYRCCWGNSPSGCMGGKRTNIFKTDLTTTSPLSTVKDKIHLKCDWRDQIIDCKHRYSCDNIMYIPYHLGQKWEKYRRYQIDSIVLSLFATTQYYNNQ